MKINARAELSDEEINNILVGVIESGRDGILYWAGLEKYHPADNWAEILDLIELDSGEGKIFGESRIKECTHKIDAVIIRRGVNKILNDPKLEIRADIRNSIMTDNMDAECYDCIIQVGLFGEIKYC